jgi:hypothetical protein
MATMEGFGHRISLTIICAFTGILLTASAFSLRVLSAESPLRSVSVVAKLLFERLVDRFNIFFLALFRLGSVSRTDLG